MTIEEIERTLQTVAEAQLAYESRQARLEEAFKQVAESHKMLVEMARIQEERIDGHDEALKFAGEKLNGLIDAQIGHESRQARLEDSFQQVAQSFKLLVELASNTDGRLDAVEEAQVHTDSRLDALIDSQIQLTHRVDSLVASQAKTDEQIGALVAAQARTDERINELINRNGHSS